MFLIGRHPPRCSKAHSIKLHTKNNKVYKKKIGQNSENIWNLVTRAFKKKLKVTIIIKILTQLNIHWCLFAPSTKVSRSFISLKLWTHASSTKIYVTVDNFNKIKTRIQGAGFFGHWGKYLHSPFICNFKLLCIVLIQYKVPQILRWLNQPLLALKEGTSVEFPSIFLKLSVRILALLIAGESLT